MKKIMVRDELEQKSKSELIDIIVAYDNYIQEANEENKYKEEWYPVCVSEFINNDNLEKYKDN